MKILNQNIDEINLNLDLLEINFSITNQLNELDITPQGRNIHLTIPHEWSNNNNDDKRNDNHKMYL